jgi:penicillin-binding protein 2
MRRLIFNVSNPYTFAEDVPVDIVAIIKENSAFYRGVEVEIVPYREYADGTLAPHILGMVGAINAEEYEQLKDSGYKLNDIIGKNGIEAAMEEYLRGVDGIKTVYTDAEGKVTTKITTPPIQGNTVILSIDIHLQRTAQEALESMLKSYKTPVNPRARWWHSTATPARCSRARLTRLTTFPPTTKITRNLPRRPARRSGIARFSARMSAGPR